MAYAGTNVGFLLTETDPVQGGGVGGSGQQLPSSSLYGGIYCRRTRDAPFLLSANAVCRHVSDIQ